MRAGHESRTYGMDTPWKDGNGSVLLTPGEKPRPAEPFVNKGEACPRCGRTSRLTWTFNKATRCVVAECPCGYYKEKFLGVTQPVTPQLISHFLDGEPYEEIICGTCGKPFIKKTKKDYTDCHSCRASAYNAEYRSRERKERRTETTTCTPGAATVPGMRSPSQERRTNHVNV